MTKAETWRNIAIIFIDGVVSVNACLQQLLPFDT